MVGPSKILTVSYGTFSCTLEGFDDPFSTMRGIAEYFRDLAADDRYFGAEPPTPDAEMLHQIAQREVKRRVEAQIEDNGITLRQVEQRAGPKPAPAETYAEDDAGDNMFADIGVDASAPAGDADDEAEATQAASVSDYGDAEPVDSVPGAFEENSVAAKLSRIRAVVSRGSAPAAETTAFSGPIERAFEDPAPDVPAPAAATAPEASPQAAEPSPAPIPDAAETPVTEEAATPAVDVEEYKAPSAAYEAAEVPGTEAPVDQDATTAEAEPLGEETAAPAGGEAHTAYDETDPWATSPEELLAAEGTAPAAPDAPAEDNSLAARIVRLKAAAAQSVTPASQSPGDNLQTAPEPEVEEDEVDASDMDGESLFASFDAEDEAEDNLRGYSQELSAGTAGEYGGDLDLDVDELVGRKTKEPELIDAPDFQKPSILDTESLAAMKAAIAEATSEIGSHDAESASDDQGSSEGEDAEQSGLAGHKQAAFENREEPGDAAFDRILEQTNSRMDDSEGNRRRSAIAHLKAAVAATKADRLMKRIKQPEEQAAEDQSQYRDDLAKVVRPRRARTEPRDDKTERPEMLDEKASPLMLVSELRVDEDGADTADAIAPRRVNTDLPEYREDEVDAGFVEFAEKMGATELPDLLEAAAAYSAFVEGRKEFSRPDLMRTVASLDQGEFTREASLRSFGQLLRQGKIQKLKRGQFTITAETRFNPQARIAGE